MKPPKSSLQISEPEFEKLLCKIIIQFSLYTQGIDRKLDPHLNQLRLQLKSGFDRNGMHKQLIDLSMVLGDLCQSSLAVNNLHLKLLFDFLTSLALEPEVLKSLEHIQSQYQANDLNDPQTLFNHLCELSLFTVSNDANHSTKDAFDEKEFLQDRLRKLLSSIEVSQQYSHRLKELKNYTRTPATAESYQKVIDSSIAFLLEIKKNKEQEHQGIEQFLSEIFLQLNQVEKHALSATQSTQTSIADNHAFTDDLAIHVENIKHTSYSANDLSTLQLSINNHLSDLTQKLDEHKQKEIDRQQQTQSQLAEMTLKLQEMESEADKLKSNLQLAANQAKHDPLTGLPNRLAYNERLEIELARWKRYAEPLSLIVWDIDHFKSINDDFGHKSGDKTLRLIAKLICDNSRETDFTARYGGEEFVTLLANTTAENSLIVANKIRNQISQTGFHAHGRSIRLTISCGISEFKDKDTQDTVFERADQALYQAKQQGRNRCKIK